MSLKVTSLSALLALSLPIVATAETPDLNTLNERYARCDALELMSLHSKYNITKWTSRPKQATSKAHSTIKDGVTYLELINNNAKLGTFSIEFDREDIGDVLKKIGNREDVNSKTIVSYQVKGKISIKFKHVTYEEAMNAILVNKGLSLHKNGRIFYIEPSNTIASPKKAAYSVSTTQKKASAKKNNKAHVGLRGDFGSVSFGKAKTKRSSNTTLYGRVAMEYSYSSSSARQQRFGISGSQNTETYQHSQQNPVKSTATESVSTMSVDVDTGSYSNVRRFLFKDNRVPPHDAVRLEEMVNYFDYHYDLPKDDKPFALNFNVIDSPWQSGAKLLRIGLQAKDIDEANLPPANLAFLIDTSGSMHSEDKLALAQKSVCYFAANLREQDTLSLITYAGYTTELLPPTAGNDFDSIYNALGELSAHGSTAGGAAIHMGYDAVSKRFNPNGINRVLIATDGDFNVGISNFEQLKSLVADKRKTGVSLTTLGFGTGNYKEQNMEQLADVGNGNYSYIDTLDEAKKVLTRQLSSTLAIVAKDVKLQIEFNPETVKEYRLVGYENRVLKNEDFSNDRIDAGDIGAGHNVTAFYEIIPQGVRGWLDEKRYQKKLETTGYSDEYALLKLRYKLPKSDEITLMETPIPAKSIPLAHADNNARFAIAIASFAQALKGGEYNGKMLWKDIINLAEGSKKPDAYHLRAQAIEMMNKAQKLGEQLVENELKQKTEDTYLGNHTDPFNTK